MEAVRKQQRAIEDSLKTVLPRNAADLIERVPVADRLSHAGARCQIADKMSETALLSTVNSAGVVSIT